MMPWCLHLFTLPQTNIAPANRPFPKGDSYSNHPFLGSSCWFQGGYMYIYNSSQWFEDSPFSLPEFLDRTEVPRLLAPSLHQTMLLTPKIQLGNSSRALDTVSTNICRTNVCVYLDNILVISNSRSFPQIGIRTQRIENGWNGSFHWETHEIEGPPDWIRLVLTSPSSQLLLPSHANLWLYADMFVFLRQSKKLKTLKENNFRGKESNHMQTTPKTKN